MWNISTCMSGKVMRLAFQFMWLDIFSVITWGITCLNCISFEWQLVNLHLIRDSEICEQSCCEGGLVKWYDSHKQILSVHNEMLIFHQLYDLYELHYLTVPPLCTCLMRCHQVHVVNDSLSFTQTYHIHHFNQLLNITTRTTWVLDFTTWTTGEYWTSHVVG